MNTSGSRDAAGGTGRVIVVGSINIDLVMRLPRLPAAGETVLGGMLARHHGGKGANQAVAAARAGARVHMIGAVGAADGSDSTAALAADGVDVTAVLACDCPTGHAAVLVARDTGENQIAVAAAANELLTPAHVRDSIGALALTPADVLVLSFEAPGAALRAAAELARAAGARLVVNPAPAQAGYADLLAGAIATPNQHELATLAAEAGLSGGERQLARALAGHTRAPVIATLGPDGALLAGHDGTEHFAGHRVQVADTTGAGDALTGVLAASLARGYPLRPSLRRAVAAAALSVTRAGARAGLPTAREIDAQLIVSG